MATVTSLGPNSYVLGTAQTGTATTDVLDRGSHRGPAAVVITSTVGADPSVTADIQGSVNGSAWFNVPYALVATPSTFVVTALTITSAVTTTYLLQTAQPWRYLRVAYTSNTNVTVTTTATL